MKASVQKFAQKVAGEGGLRLLSTLFVLYLARFLGAEEFGRYSTALAYAAVCIVLVDLGTNAILTREIARRPDEKVRIAEASHALKMLAALFSWTTLAVLTYVLGFKSDDRGITLCLGIVVIGQTLTEYFSSLLNGIEEMGWEAFLKVAARGAALSFGFVAIVQHKTLPEIAARLALGTGLGYAISVILVRSRFSSFGLRWDGRYTHKLLTTSLPLFGSALFWILYNSQD